MTLRPRAFGAAFALLCTLGCGDPGAAEDDAGAAGEGAGRGGSGASAGSGGSAGTSGTNGSGAGGTGVNEGGASGASDDSGGRGPISFGAPETLLEGLDYPVRLVVDTEWIYLTLRGSLDVAGGSILRVRKDGSDPETLADARGAPFALALDGDTLYWTEVLSPVERGVYRLVLGGAPERLQQTTAAPTALLVAAERLYWGTTAGAGSATLSWSSKSAQEVLGSVGGFTSLIDLVPVPAHSWLAALDAGTPASPASVQLIAPDAEIVNVAELGPDDAQNGVVLSDSDSLLFTSPTSGTLASLSLEQATSQAWAASSLPHAFERPWGIAADESFVYLSERAEGTIDYCALAEGSVKAIDRHDLEATPLTLASGLHCPSRLAVEDSALYFVTNGVEGESSGTLVKIPISR